MARTPPTGPRLKVMLDLPLSPAEEAAFRSDVLAADGGNPMPLLHRARKVRTPCSTRRGESRVVYPITKRLVITEFRQSTTLAGKSKPKTHIEVGLHRTLCEMS